MGLFKNIDGRNADRTQNMFIVTILEKTEELRLKFSKGNEQFYKRWWAIKKWELN